MGPNERDTVGILTLLIGFIAWVGIGVAYYIWKGL